MLTANTGILNAGILASLKSQSPLRTSFFAGFERALDAPRMNNLYTDDMTRLVWPFVWGASDRDRFEADPGRQGRCLIENPGRRPRDTAMRPENGP